MISGVWKELKRKGVRYLIDVKGKFHSENLIRKTKLLSNF